MKKHIKNSINKNANEIYVKMVEAEDYPDTPLVPVSTKFEDERGIIQNLVFTNIQGAAIITSKKGTERSNHFHRTDWHFVYVLSGEIEYYERDVSADNWNEPITVKAGEMVFSAPLKVHRTVFKKDTVLISLSRNKRTHELHEKDVCRVETK